MTKYPRSIALIGVMAIVLLGGLIPTAAAAEPEGSSPLGSSELTLGSLSFDNSPPTLNLGEYRVHKQLTLNLGPGVQGGVQAINSHCVNANGEFPFHTTSWDPQVHDLWIDASVSFPACFADLSYMTFSVYVTSPYQANLKVGIGQRYDGGPYDIYCDKHIDDPSTDPLWCENNYDVSNEIGQAVTVTSS